MPINCWYTYVIHISIMSSSNGNHFPRYWPFVRGIYSSQANSPCKGQWCGALMFSLICAWRNGWANKRDTGDLSIYLLRIYLFSNAVFNCRHRISYCYTSFCRHISADFNGWFLSECCHVNVDHELKMVCVELQLLVQMSGYFLWKKLFDLVSSSKTFFRLCQTYRPTFGYN